MKWFTTIDDLLGLARMRKKVCETYEFVVLL